MGWGTYLVTSMYFSRDTFKNKHQVEEELKSVRNKITSYKDRLKSLAIMTEPQKFCPEDCSPLEWIEDQINDIFTELEWEYTKDYKLTMLLDAWDKCHDNDGNAIVPPKPFKVWDMDFCGGDFIKEVYPDGTPVENSEDYE